MSIFAKRPILVVAAALTPWAVSACSKSDPSGVEQAQTGVVNAVVHDSAAALPSTRTDPWPADSMDYDGTLNGSAEVDIYSDADGWISLGDPTDVVFDIFCEEFGLVADHATVSTGTYSKVRITLHGFVANVLAGGVIAGSTLAEAKVITLGGPDADVVIEKDVTPFDVTATTPTWIDFDLNTDVWINSMVADAGTIDAGQVQAATVVYIRQ